MHTPHSLIRALGPKRIASAVGVKIRAVYQATYRGALPAAWFPACSALGAELGVEIPPACFSFRAPHNVEQRDMVNNGNSAGTPVGQGAE